AVTAAGPRGVAAHGEAAAPSPRAHPAFPLTSWDLSLLPADYLQYGLLFAPPPFSTAHLVDHLQAALAGALAVYYPV
ncbi:unnamed protein product, partial [Urochloa humidicola]